MMGLSVRYDPAESTEFTTGGMPLDGTTVPVEELHRIQFLYGYYLLEDPGELPLNGTRVRTP